MKKTATKNKITEEYLSEVADDMTEKADDLSTAILFESESDARKAYKKYKKAETSKEYQSIGVRSQLPEEEWSDQTFIRIPFTELKKIVAEQLEVGESIRLIVPGKMSKKFEKPVSIGNDLMGQTEDSTLYTIEKGFYNGCACVTINNGANYIFGYYTAYEGEVSDKNVDRKKYPCTGKSIPDYVPYSGLLNHWRNFFDVYDGYPDFSETDSVFDVENRYEYMVHLAKARCKENPNFDMYVHSNNDSLMDRLLKEYGNRTYVSNSTKEPFWKKILKWMGGGSKARP